MRNIKRAIVGGLASVLALGSTGALADCVQANFQGTYQAYVLGQLGSSLSWSSCRVAIGATGAITNTTCATSAGVTLPLQGSSVKLVANGGPNCSFVGTLIIAGQSQTTSSLTLSDDHNTAAGVGTAAGHSFAVNMVRIN